MSDFAAPTRIVSAPLATLTGLLPAGRIAIVADRGVADAGMLERVLAPGRVVVALVDPDPTVAAAEAAAAAAQGCDAVLMIGGGSALGVGKAVALRLTNPGPIDRYEGRDQAARAPVPSVAIPTTAGSGSEVSNALVLHDDRRDRLVVVRGRGYEPDIALLDGELLRSLPDRPMLHAGLDALSHALEALWANGATSFTDALALAAARELRATLPRALRERTHLQRLLEASTMANLACGPAGLGLVHALSSATSVTLPHGLQNGILLPRVAAFNREHVSPDARAEIDLLPRLYAELGFDERLPAGVADAMVAAALENPFRANNRRPSTAADLYELVSHDRDRTTH